jgi:hypothetical protein
MKLLRFLIPLVALIVLGAAPIAWAQEGAPPAPPTNVVAADTPYDGGEAITVTWDLSEDDGDKTRLAGYRVYRTRTAAEQDAKNAEEISLALAKAKADATKLWREELALAEGDETDPQAIEDVRRRRSEAAAQAKEAAEAVIAARAGETQWEFVSAEIAGTKSLTIDKLAPEAAYRFAVEAVSPEAARSERIETTAAVSPALQWFAGSRLWLAIITVILCGSVVAFIGLARTGIPLKVRKIAGLEAVDEAVGRATEMGRSCLFIPGIQDMNDIQTIAGITVLSRVAKTAAEYDARIEVPTSRSLVMTTARETVQAAFLTAGRPDAYNEDLIYYVTDEQFGYVAYLSGMMVREKPAACFYMGSFFAESLILAETGNSIGAIQVAGTAQPAQLPFFVAACDYTLIGEEFFAASAYLSGSPEELGSLKGQDVGKVIVAIGILVGVAVVTLWSIGIITGNEGMAKTFGQIGTYIREIVLT